MFASACLAVCVLLGQVSAAVDDDLPREVRGLVQQLGAARLAEREAAERKLTELGPAVLDLLPETTDRTAAEIRQRLGRIRQKLQRAAARSAAKASTVTLGGQAMRLSAILDAIGKQTGNKIVLSDRLGSETGKLELNVDFDKTPFWKALDSVLDQAKLTVYAFGMERAITVVTRTETQLPRSAKACYSGPLRFEAVRIDARRELRDPANQSLRLVVEIAWEPRLAPICLKQSVADVKAVDEAGRPLTMESLQAVLEVPVNPELTAVELTLPLALPPRSVREIALLEGTLEALLPGRVETFRFDKLTTAKSVEKRVGAATVVLEQVRRNGPVWEVLIRVRFDKAGGALESYRGWIFNNPAYLEGSDGKPIPNDGFETTHRTENEVGIAYLFELDGPPTDHSFVYKTPGTIISARFPYTIRGVKLP